jgi:acyl-CoA thioesterase-1
MQPRCNPETQVCGSAEPLFKLFRLSFLAFFTLYVVFWTANARADESVGPYVLVLGDSLTAGYMLDPQDSFPAQLQDYLQKEDANIRVINAGVSGDTSGGALWRIDWALQDIPGGSPNLAIIELGANDAMQGIPPQKVRENLSAIIAKLKGTGARILLAGMLAPPNMGPDYAAEFDGMYAELAAEHDVALYPFFLEGVATIAHLNLYDGKHPTGEGVGIIVERIGPMVKKLLAE